MARLATRSICILLAGFGLPALADDASETLPPVLTSTFVMEAFHARELMEYSCPESARCEVRCNGVESQDKFHYMNVRRLEIAPGKAHWLLSASHLDAVGKAHKSAGMLPVPVSCILDDLVLDRISHLSDGELTRPESKQKVIFDVEPQ